ncbi:MAG: CapA family protein [Alphaproteobacteria bacterium]|nr:CapA family protein [Alphaproteobacteria bacterium]
MRIVATGDSLFSSRNLAKRLDPALISTFAGADGAFTNAEFICPRHGTPPAPRRFITAVDAAAIDELTSLGINLISFANNHAGDFGHQGVIDTIEAAEARGVVYSGIGRSLEEARAAKFLDTPKGRIAIISASTTRSTEFAASSPGVGIAPRAGLNPLRWGRAYVLPDKEFAEMLRIEAMLGIQESRREVLRVEVVKDPGPDRFGFGSFFEGSLQIERGASAHVRYFTNEGDARAILEHIRDAANRADCVLFSLHTHEGTNENWYSPRPAPFIEAFARKAIEAGAHAVFGHGAHMLRGIELHQGRPIFYNLNSLMMEFEAGEQKMTPEMYTAYGFGRDALPSHLHMSRVADDKGNRIGFYAEKRFSRSCLAVCDFDGKDVAVRVVPVDLDLNRARPSERGLPAIAAPAEAREIAKDLAAMSEVYGTRIRYDEAANMIAVG